MAVDGERVGGPRLRTDVVAVSIRVRSVESRGGVISHLVRRVYVARHDARHLTVRIKLPRWLSVEGLRLETMGAGRARRQLIVIQVVMMMMMTVHRDFGRLINFSVVHTSGTFSCWFNSLVIVPNR